jgi:hypothetical protein
MPFKSEFPLILQLDPYRRLDLCMLTRHDSLQAKDKSEVLLVGTIEAQKTKTYNRRDP